mmetsp:Transcript_53487/g.61367  ORF Transcript_53487/g.61367 Transcript_53487/m.61367 type:complete len:515 (-) Transcript_53487:98-1642(-)
MSKKSQNNAKVGVKNATSMSEDEATAYFWKILKNGDREEIETFLFTKHVDEATGEVSLTCSPKARALCNSRNAKQLTPLCFVADNGLEDLVAPLVRAGAHVNAVDGTKERRTPLHSAVAGEDDVMFQNLLRCGADVAVKDGEGRNTLHIAARMGCRAIYGYVLQLSEVPLEEEPLVDGVVIAKVDGLHLMEVQDASGATPVHYAMGELAGGKPSVDIASLTLDFLLREQKKSSEHEFRVKRLLTSQTKSGCTPLHCLAASGVSDIAIASMVSKLVQMGCSPIAADCNGQTALHYAASTLAQNAEVFAAIVKVLPDAAQRCALGKVTEGGHGMEPHMMTALEIAVDESNKAVVEWIVKHAERDTFIRTTESNLLSQLASNATPALRSMLIGAKLVDEALVTKLVEAEDAEEESAEEEPEDARGDYSGHGSSTFAGSRVQQARRAAHQKRKEGAEERSSAKQAVEESIAAASHRREELKQQKKGLGLGAKILIIVLMLSMVLPALDLLFGGSKQKK